MKRLRNLVFFRKNDRRGVALVLVLAFVVLLASIIVAFFSRAQAEQQISRSSANQTKVKLLADGAVDTIVGDLKSEIVAGSTDIPISAGGVTTHIYTPRSNTGQRYAQNSGAYTTMLPATQGFTRAAYTPGTADPLANLVKVSANAPFYPGANGYTVAGPTRAAASPTNTGARPISPARWNKPLFLTATSTTDLTPPGTFPIPNWIYVAQDGTNATAPDPQVTGRYAYAIYDEGGLLDINVAGYPGSMAPTTALPDAAFKNALAYADLTQIGLNQTQINNIVSWRNAASSATTDKYKKYAFFNQSGFLKTANEDLTAGASDRMFSSRQQFIDFLRNKVGNNLATQNTLQYLTTFSRDRDQPSYIRLQATNAGSQLDYNAGVPKVLGPNNGGNYYKGNDSTQNHDHLVNPSFPSVRVTASGFSRNDGSTPVVGEPLVKKRFALNRLAWITYRGPSASRAQGDLDIQALINNGIPWEYLQKGTAENIRNYFGLQWDGSKWTYSNNHAGVAGPIHNLADLTGTREPDFFELLKATINVGSVGRALVPPGSPLGTSVPADPGSDKYNQPYNYNFRSESSVDFQIIQIGANIISQFQTANYPPRIDFNDGANFPRTIVGVANLPYLANILTGVIQCQSPDPKPDGIGRYAPGQTLTNDGLGALVQMPVIWNPHDPSSSIGAVGPTNFRVTADSAAPDPASPHAQYFVYAGISPNSSFEANGGKWYCGTGAALAHQFTADNTAIEFQTGPLTATSRTLFPEPTMMMRPGSITDLNGNRVTVNLASGHLMKSDPVCPLLSSFRGPNGGLRNLKENALNMPAGRGDSAGTPYIGFYLGAFPLAWTSPPGAQPHSAQEGGYGPKLARVDTSTSGKTESCYFTYRMEYQDSSGGWVTYDTKYGKVTNGPTNFNIEKPSLICGISEGWPPGNGYWAMATDPRTSRFGLLWNGTAGVQGKDCAEASATLALPLPGPGFAGSPIVYGYGWLDKASGAIYSIRADADSGYYAMEAMNGWDAAFPSFGQGLTGWMAKTTGDSRFYTGLCPGLLSQNNTDIRYSENAYYGQGAGTGTSSPNYFADPDGIVRRAMGAFVPLGTSASPTAGNPFSNADGKLPSADTTVGLPMARAFGWIGWTGTPCRTEINYASATQITSQAQSRPYFLHRPFRSVAELGCVFSDTPWRNLDFSTAESGSTALLDVFSINDDEDASGLIAGKVNLNTRQETVLQAILAGGCIDLAQPQSAHATGRMDAATSRLLAQALITRTTSTAITGGLGPLVNVSDLVGRFVSKSAIQRYTPNGRAANVAPLSPALFSDGKLSYAGFSGGAWDTGAHGPKSSNPAMDVYSAYKNSGTFSTNLDHNGTQESMGYIQRFREAPIRALAAAGQTRVWNLMLDVVAQSGRFPATAASFNNFSVQGEQRYWVHLAIDRLTGEVLDKQVEVVKE